MTICIQKPYEQQLNREAISMPRGPAHAGPALKPVRPALAAAPGRLARSVSNSDSNSPLSMNPLSSASNIANAVVMSYVRQRSHCWGSRVAPSPPMLSPLFMTSAVRSERLFRLRTRRRL